MTSTATAAAQMAKTATVTAAPVVKTSAMSRADFVMEHARAYPGAGWDVVTESVGYENVVKAVGRTRTMTGAVNVIRSSYVAPWVCQLLEMRPGSDDDGQLTTARRLHDEITENWADATARLEGRANKARPPRSEIEALGFSVPAAPAVIEIDLTEAPAGVNAPAVPAQGSGRQAPSGRATRKPRARKAAQD